MIWDDRKWSELRYDLAEFAQRCEKAGFPKILGFINGRPRFAGEVDWERVQEFFTTGAVSREKAAHVKFKSETVAPSVRSGPVKQARRRPKRG